MTSTSSAAAAPAPRVAATSSTATSSTKALATSNPNGSNSNKFHPVGRYANESLSILRRAYAAAPTGGDNKRPRVKDCANVVGRLVHPLFLYANDNNRNNISHELCGDDSDSGNEAKKRRVDGKECSGESGDSAQMDVVASGGTEYQSQLRAELERYKRENLLLVKRRENVFKSLVTLHEMYETGLDGIARSNDLRFVPDNVMPDKLPK
jgi:hypothetical protein